MIRDGFDMLLYAKSSLSSVFTECLPYKIVLYQSVSRQTL